MSANDNAPAALGQLLHLPRRPGQLAAPAPRRGPHGIEFWLPCDGCAELGYHPRNPPQFASGATGRWCPACTDKQRAARAAENRTAIVARALASIPERHRWATFDAPELSARVRLPLAVRLAAKLAPLQGPRLVLLVGPTGAGKTTLATAMLRWHLDGATAEGASEQARSWGARALWVPARKLAIVRRESGLGSEPELLTRAREASVLLVDDLGQEAPADKDDVVAVLSERQAEGRPTLVTWGFALDDLATRYGAHLERRLCEGAGRVDLGGAR